MEYEIIRSSRKTLAIHITRDRRVEVRAPLWATDGEIQQLVQEKSRWIEKAFARMEAVTLGEKLTPQELMELARQALEDIPERAARFGPAVGAGWRRITIRAQVSRWGSCSSRGNLSFNCLLMLAPPEVRDYVVVHELCHRKHMNHSPAFWEEVRRVLPEYETPKKWLKEHGAGIIGRLR